ncbi:hypothetical protein [Rhodococcus jostii]|uniref:hypothetical protein n=1 Tax=Rhodococcus jostii TaxID=132919 RepID=UPI0036452E77
MHRNVWVSGKASVSLEGDGVQTASIYRATLSPARSTSVPSATRSLQARVPAGRARPNE